MTHRPFRDALYGHGCKALLDCELDQRLLEQLARAAHPQILSDHGNRPDTCAGLIGGNEDAVLQLHPGLLFDNLSDYLFWAFIARREKYPAQDALQQIDGAALQQVVLKMIQEWHPSLQQLVRESVPSTIISKPLHTSLPVKHWATRRITLLGDAIHSMPPTRGIGGNTALRDAQLLCQELVAARSGEKSLLQGIQDYEAEMIKYSFAAVRGSMQALQLHVADSRLLSTLMLRSMQALFALQRFGRKQRSGTPAVREGGML